MTLHQTRETIIKFGIGSVISFVIILFIVIIYRVGVGVKNTLYPPKIQPPNSAYDVLPSLQFPKSATNGNLTYTLNTLTGALPDFPDRLYIYPFVRQEPNFLNLDKAKQKAAILGFLNQAGSVVPEIPLGNANYEWDDPEGVNRKLIFNIVSFDFKMSSNYLTSLTVLNAQNLSNQKSAINVAKIFLDNIALFPQDIDLDKTNSPDKNVSYLTYPQLFSIKNSILTPTTSLSKAQVIWVDFYQKDIEYELNTGVQEGSGFKKIKMKLPILYPHPPNSIMSFWVASGQSDAEVVAAKFVHKDISVPTGTEPATYAIKTGQEAFDDLKNGKAYVASFAGSDSQVLINNVYLAYYIGEEKQDYLMPIVVFEGDKDFFAYVSAVKNEWVK